MQSQNKNKKFIVENEYHTLLRMVGLKIADKKFFLRQEVKFVGHFTSPEGM